MCVLAYDGLAMFEFAVACEVFGPIESRTLDVPWYRLTVCGESDSVRVDNGLVVQVPRSLAALRFADTVVVPPTERPEAVSDAVLAALRRAHGRGARIVSLCTGAFVLARAGLLDGRRAVTHWADCESLRVAFPAVAVDADVLYVDEGDILTSAGSAASIDLCLHLVRLDHGAEVATRLARQLVVQPHRDGGQAQFVDTPLPEPVAGSAFADTLSWLDENLAEPVSVADLAARSAMSARSFTRHFSATTGSTPYQWLLHRRVRLAERLLERTDLPVEVVAERAGLGDATNLRKHFRRHVGRSPHAYRRAFGERAG